MRIVKEIERKYYKTIFENSTPGQYSLFMDMSANYIVQIFGAGGGAAGGGYNNYWHGIGGSSGAGFIGLITIPSGTYTVTVGKGGNGAAANGYSGGANYSVGSDGGNSSIGSLIVAGGGKGARYSYDSNIQGEVGTMSINATIISTTKNSSGNKGESVGNGSAAKSYLGGTSVYNNTTTGYGAGGSGTSCSASDAKNGLDGYVKIYKESTSADYDYYIDITTYKTPKTIERTYYKYIRQDWTQPILSSNGTIGGNSFAVSYAGNYTMESLHAFKAMDGNNSTFCQWKGKDSWFLIYNPKPIKVSSIYFKFYDSSVPSWLHYIDGSNDNINWDRIQNLSIPAVKEYTLNVNTEKAYKYYRIYTITSLGAGSWIDIYTITLNAIQQETIESTPDDYDFYIDTPTYYGINQ